MNHLDLGDPEVFDAIRDVRDDSTSTSWFVFGFINFSNFLFIYYFQKKKKKVPFRIRSEDVAAEGDRDRRRKRERACGRGQRRKAPLWVPAQGHERDVEVCCDCVVRRGRACDVERPFHGPHDRL